MIFTLINVKIYIMKKIILWDLDGTILNFQKAEYGAIKKCFQILNLGCCSDEMVDHYNKINIKWWEALERNEYTKKEILINRFIEFFEFYHIDIKYAKQFNDLYQVTLGDFVYFMDYALDTLLTLKKENYIQCVITNGTKIAQTKKLNRSKLIDVFDYIFISEDIGYEKPNPQFISEVMKKINHYNKDEMIIVGDSLTSDILLGNNTSIETIYYNPEGKPNNKNIHYDYEIKDLRDVIKIVKNTTKKDINNL